MAAAALALLATFGCALFGGDFEPPTVCESEGVSAAADLEDAPIWVTGSPQRANMPTTGCIGGDGSHHADRLCVVAAVEGLTSVQQAELTARKKSERLLGEELEARLGAVLAGASPQPPSAEIKAFSKQLRDSIGHVTGSWQSPNCTMYAIAELELDDFKFVVEGPALSAGARALLLQQADAIAGTP